MLDRAMTSIKHPTNEERIMKRMRAGLVAVIDVTLAMSWLASPAAATLKAYYPMDEGRGSVVADTSGNGHNGTAQNGAPTWVDGPTGFGKALSFDGSNPAKGWIHCGTWNPSDTTGQLTVAFWIRWQGTNGSWQGVVAKRDGFDPASSPPMMWCIEVDQTTGTISLTTRDSYPPGAALTKGQWTHVAVTFNGTTLRWYVGGIEKASGSFAFGPKTNATVMIGCDNLGGYNGFNGAIDEVRIYDTALTASQIQALLLPTPQSVAFGDPKLKAAVESALGVTNPTTADMLRLTTLTVRSMGITSLTGLESATNLKSLYVEENSISNLAPLKNLTQMEELRASSNQIQDVSALSSMTALKVLHLRVNQIADISPLAGLVTLRDLEFYRNQIQDVSALRNMTGLTVLELSNNQVADISPLAGLTNLHWLWLDGNRILEDVSVLRNMTALTDLRLNANQITDISPLASLTRVTFLTLSINSIQDISILRNMTTLTYLDLAFNQVDDISPLAGLTNLTNLLLQSNKIQDVLALRDMTALTELKLQDNKISDISPLSLLNKLKTLYLTGNPLAPGAEAVITQIKNNNPGIDLQYDPIPPYSGGSGTETDPYQIDTAEGLIYLGNTTNDYSKHFILTSDIDLSGYTFDHAVICPVVDLGGGVYSSPVSFTGIFNGNGHVIHNLHIVGSRRLGLFGHVGACSIMNLGLEEVSIQGTEDYVGGLGGCFYGDAIWSNCYCTGSISGRSGVGGLVGYTAGSLSNCYSACVVSGTGHFVGGLVGEVDKGNVSNCYSTGVVTGGGDQSYNVGGLVGESFGTVSSSFWDIQTSGLIESAGGTGLSTAEMQDISTYLIAGWDFADETVNGPNDVWAMPVEGGYPIFAWQVAEYTTEDFETGDFSKYPWAHGGDSPWQISTEAQSGTYSARSGLISSDEASLLSLLRSCGEGRVSFYLRTSSESCCDKLSFIVDGMEKGNWAGETGWTRVSFTVAAGPHIFTWMYSKDASVDNGEDAAWIDNIMFP
jgi:Leucine-rich repeat (LRR) protein